MAERRSISKKTRFEVFKRDSFTCQYCGQMAPDVVLEVDHIYPVSKGGSNDLMNLVTSCKDCNGGKGPCELDDKSALKKQQLQLAEINERRAQLQMMLEWKHELSNLAEEQIDAINVIISDAYDCSLTSHGRAGIRRLLTRFGFDAVYEATEIAVARYSEADYAVSKIGGICYNRRRDRLDGE